MLLKRREFEMVSRQEIEKTEELKNVIFMIHILEGHLNYIFSPVEQQRIAQRMIYTLLYESFLSQAK